MYCVEQVVARVPRKWCRGAVPGGGVLEKMN